MGEHKVYRQAACAFCGVTKYIAARGLCRACYYREKRSGTLEYQPRRQRNFCDEDGCGKPVMSHGKCDVHRKRWRKTHGPVKKELSQTPNAIAGREYRKRKFLQGKRSDLKKAFGITLEQYQEMWAQQKGFCAICGEAERRLHRATGQPMNLAVDHCHTTKMIRELLCSPCNHAIGLLNDSPKKLRAAADYLERHGCV